MAALTTDFSFCIIQILILVTSTEADPNIEVHPSQISLGISSSLDINCSFSSVDHPEMAEFASLILSKANSSGQNFQDLAAVTQFTPDSITMLTQEKVTATGVHSQTGESFIEVTWEFPTATQGGVYRCSAHGLDTLGQPIEMVNISTVTVGEANLNDIFDKLKQMEIHETAMESKMSEMEKHIEALEYNNSQISSYITDQDNTITSMEKNIQDLQNNNSQMSSYITDQDNTITGMEQSIQDLQNINSQMSSYITDLQDTMATLQRLQRIDYLGTYQDHYYYISKEAYGKIDHAMDVCKSCGGYLTEIDNQNEFNAMISFLDLTSGFDYAMIAGTDEAVDGTWRLQSNNKPLPFTSWYSSGASTGTSYNCLGLHKGYSWNMDDFSCNYDPPENSFRFTCEIPRV